MGDTVKTYKLAELLLRRKELQDRLARLRPLQEEDIVRVRVKRTRVEENFDEILASVPQISINQVTGLHNWLAKQLRLVDGMIQQANWTTDVPVVDDLDMGDYVDDRQDDGQHNEIRAGSAPVSQPRPDGLRRR